MTRLNALSRIILLTLLSYLCGSLTALFPLPGLLALLPGLFILPLGILFCYWRPYNKAISTLGRWADRIGTGELTASPPLQGDLQKLVPRLTEMGRSLDDNIAGFIRAANQVCLAGGTLDSCAAQAADNATSQAAQTHRISSAAEQVSVAIHQITANAEAVSAGASTAMERAHLEHRQAMEAEQAAQNVLRQTEELAEAIQGLGDRLTEITGIVTMIRGVANQTNLLALNASIEAARAGSHGRGFAVVANEVKNLAAHTLSATDDIASRIHRFQQETASTVEATGETLTQVKTSAEGLARVGKAMGGMVESFSTAHSQVEEITLAVREQQEAIHGLTANIEQVAQLAEDMDATARGVHEEARLLTDISDELLPLLGSFRLAAHDRVREVISGACSDPGLQARQRVPMEQVLRQLAARHDYLELLYVTDHQGRQVTSNIFASNDLRATYDSDGFAMDWSQRPWFQDAMSRGECIVTPFYRSAATHRFCFTVAGPIRDADGAIVSVLGADVDVAALLNG